MRSALTIGCGVAVLVLSGVVPGAVAQEARGASEAAMADTEHQMSQDDERARRHFQTARTLYSQGRFNEAAVEFEAAYQLSNRAQLLYNIYLAHRDAANVPQAIQFLRAYLDRMPDIAEREALIARLESMERDVERRAAERGSGERVIERRVERVETRVERPSRNLVGPLVTTGVGGALLVAGTVFGLVALDKTAKIEDACPENFCRANMADDIDDARTFVRLADYSFLVGGVTVAVGLGWLLFGGDDDTERPAAGPPPVSAACDGSGCVAAVSGRF